VKLIQRIGLAAMAAGVFGAIWLALFFDISIQVEPGKIGQPEKRVANIDLMSQRQSGLIVCGIVAVVGTILFVANPKIETRQGPSSGAAMRLPGGQQCPRCGLISPPTAKRCDCGFTFL